MSEDKSPVESAFGNSDLCRLKVERAGKGRSGVGLYCDIATPPMEYNVCLSCLA